MLHSESTIKQHFFFGNVHGFPRAPHILCRWTFRHGCSMAYIFVILNGACLIFAVAGNVLS